MLTDEYLIEYLVAIGYNREDVLDPKFNILSIKEDLTTPINLSKVTNVEDLKLLFAVPTIFLVNKECIDSGKLYRVSELLMDVKFIGVDPNLSIDKVFVSRNDCRIFKGDIKYGINKNVVLENFNLENTEFVIGDMPIKEIIAQANLGGEQIENSAKTYIFVESQEGYSENQELLLVEASENHTYPKLKFINCTHLNLDKIDKFKKVSLSGCKDVKAAKPNNICELEIDDHRDDNLDFIDKTSEGTIKVENMHKLDLSSIHKISNRPIEFSNIDECYLLENCEAGYYANFINTKFDNPNKKRISFEKDVKIGCSNFNSDASMMEIKGMTIIENCDMQGISNITKMIQTDKIVLDGIQNIDVSIEKIIRELIEKNANLKIANLKAKEGYDIRRIEDEIDLRKTENKDILESNGLLELIVKDNPFLNNIKVNECLTEDQKAILRKFAPNKNYTYNFKGDGLYKEEGHIQGEDVSFEEFERGEKIFNDIVDHIDKTWGELEKFKHIYNELGQQVSYDINALEGNEDKDSFNSANLIARNPFSSILSGRGICGGYAEMYQYVCRKAELTCFMESGDDHRYNIIEYTDDNGEKAKSYCDLTWDSDQIKRNGPCRYFAKSEYTFGNKIGHRKLQKKGMKDISMSKMVEIDKNIGYMKGEEYITKRYLDIINEAQKIGNITEKTKYILENMMKVQNISSMSNNEIIEFAEIMLETCGFDSKSFGDTQGFIRRKEMADKDPRCILWVKDEDKNADGRDKYLYYTFNSQQQSFKVLEEETIEELIASGMLEFYKGQTLPGFEKQSTKKESRQNNEAARQ